MQFMVQSIVTILSFNVGLFCLRLMNSMEQILDDMVPTVMITKQIMFTVCNPEKSRLIYGENDLIA